MFNGRIRYPSFNNSFSLLENVYLDLHGIRCPEGLHSDTGLLVGFKMDGTGLFGYETKQENEKVFKKIGLTVEEMSIILMRRVLSLFTSRFTLMSLFLAQVLSLIISSIFFI